MAFVQNPTRTGTCRWAMAVCPYNGAETGRLWHADIRGIFGQPNIIWDIISMDAIWHTEASRF